MQLSTADHRTFLPHSVQAESTDAVREGMDWWIKLLGCLLAGYALFGKGFAYLGVQPIFVGELVLALGLFTLALGTTWRHWLYSPCVWLILFYCIWGVFQTVPYWSTYGFDALRDAVVYGYSLFALIVMAHLTAMPTQLVAILRNYGRLTLWLVLLPLPLWYLGRSLLSEVYLPWAQVPLLAFKGGDVATHLSGVFAFWVAYPEQAYRERTRLFGMVILAAGVLAIGSETRSGLLAFVLVFAICLLAYPRNRSIRQLVIVGIVALLALGVTGIRVPLGEREREISFEQVGNNLLSVVVGGKQEELDVTKSWRIEWWKEIVEYTIDGKYFWTGKGFGVNLADDDGFQVLDEDDGPVLRSPHNIHLTVLARAGVPGMLLWLSVLAAWASGMFTGFLRARRNGDALWAGLFVFLFCYWIAMLVQATFDVYLEGPLGGIWFWTIYGVGIASLWLYRYQPEILQTRGERYA